MTSKSEQSSRLSPENAGWSLTPEQIEEKIGELEDMLFQDKTMKRSDRIAQLKRYKKQFGISDKEAA